MTGLTSVKKFIISLACAFIFILYVPTACMLSSSLHEEIDYANAGERDTELCELCEETTECQDCIYN